MATYRLKTRCMPRSKLVRDGDPTDRLVRVWKNSPEDLTLQIWSGKRYTLVNLYPDEARDIAAELLAVAKSIEEG